MFTSADGKVAGNERLSDGVPIILTEAVAQSDAEFPFVVPMLEFVARRGEPLILFVLQIAADENRKRLADPERVGAGKLTIEEILDELRAKHTLLHLPRARVMDVTMVSPAHAASKMAQALL